jgi:hypothetical protein
MNYKLWLLWRNVRFWWQRRTRGWSDDELWNLDVTFANFILPRLKQFRKEYGDDCHPDGFKSVTEWNGVLDEMIEGFELMANDGYCITDKNVDAKIDRACTLFGQYVRALWN